MDNWEDSNASGLCVALELKRTQSPVSKLTDRQDALCLQKDKHSTKCKVLGTSEIVSSGALKTNPVTSSNDCWDGEQSAKERIFFKNNSPLLHSLCILSQFFTVKRIVNIT